MKIIRLISSNFKRLVAVEITPAEDGSLVLVTGKNGAGKSSVLDAIMTTLAGGKSAPDKPIREGEAEAENTIVTENYSITRTFNEKGSKLVIKNADGFAASSPQKLLDKIVGDLSFDPMEFIRMGNTEAGKKEQRRALMGLAGLDFSDIDSMIATTKAERADVRKDKERYEHEAERIVVADGTPDKEVGVLELTDELQEAVDHNAKITRLSEDESMMIGETQNLEEAKRKLTEKIEGLQAEINTLEASYGRADEKQELRQKELEEITGRLTKSERTDVAEIEAKIATSQVVNIAVRLKIQKAELTKQAEAKAKEWRTLGKDAKDLEGKKAIRLAKAKMPLEGLSVTDDCVVLGKIPLSQVNDAKKLEVGLGIAMAQNPELKVILMNGNDLDEDSLKVISKMTKDKGFQVWIERIEGEGGIVIEDGMVKQ